MVGLRQWLGVAGLLVAAAVVAGCAPAENYRAMVQSDDPLIRARGCKLAGESKRADAVPLLVDRLEDRDAAVRVVAIIALQKIAGTDMDYRESDPPAARARAIARWRQHPAAGGRPNAAAK